MLKNVASQKIGAQLVSATDGSAFTGSVTVYVTGDAGTQAAGSVGAGACTHEGNGYHTYAPAQAETNYDLVAFTFTGTGAVPATVQVYPIPEAGLLSNVIQISGDSGAADVLESILDGTGGKIKLSSGLSSDPAIDIESTNGIPVRVTSDNVATAVQINGDLQITGTIINAFFTGCSNIAKWLRTLARVDEIDAPTLAEINDAAGTFDPVSMSLQATGTTVEATLDASITSVATIASAAAASAAASAASAASANTKLGTPNNTIAADLARLASDDGFDGYVDAQDSLATARDNLIAIQDLITDVYHADITLICDELNSQDEYIVIWFKNGIRQTGGITAPTIQVVKRVDGTDLIASTAMTQIGSTQAYKYTASGSERQTAGEGCLVIVGATIAAGGRTFAKALGRDSAA